ncbi:MAG TPA: response regulator [Bryobacteraceae bacterium]|nr:response regulator [Bryobacteraceae bacterium]HXJ38346.1 response regulator [Bryobacteraceae bacterium]
MGQRLKKLDYDDGAIILVGDDEVAIRDVLHAQLTARGHLVYEARTGDEVRRAVSLMQPDVILLDLGLPDIGGIEVEDR